MNNNGIPVPTHVLHGSSEIFASFTLLGSSGLLVLIAPKMGYAVSVFSSEASVFLSKVYLL